jgi:thioredoxin-like negative regulator of GroEL
VLLQSGELNAAEEAFRASLATAPNNGWALFGLAEVYRRMGRADALAEVTRRLDAAWAGDRGALVIERL